MGARTKNPSWWRILRSWWRGVSILSRIGEVGIFESGPHEGKYVVAYRDGSDAGWHVEIMEQWPGKSQEGWDIWAEDDNQLQELFESPEFDVSWTGRSA